MNWNLPAGAKSGRPQKASVPSQTEGMSGEPKKAKENEKENGKKMERRFFGGQAAPRVYDLLPKRGHFTCPLPEQTQQRFGKQSVPNGIAKIRRLWYTDRSKARIGFPWRSDKLEFN